MKAVALQDILHHGRMHKPGETIDCSDPELLKKWIASKAVKVVGDALPRVTSTEEPALTPESPPGDEDVTSQEEDTPEGHAAKSAEPALPKPEGEPAKEDKKQGTANDKKLGRAARS